MHVIELFKKVKVEEILDEYNKLPGVWFDVDIDNRLDEIKRKEIKEKLIEKYKEEILKIKEKNVELTNDSMISIVEDNKYFELVMGCTERKKELLEAAKCTEYTKFSNPLYGLMFSDRNKILGMLVSKNCIDRIGEAKTLAVILNEITFFGIDEDISKETQLEHIEELDKISKEIEEGKAECKCFSIDEIRKELGLEEEKTNFEEEMKRIEEENNIRIHNTIECIKEINKELFS